MVCYSDTNNDFFFFLWGRSTNLTGMIWSSQYSKLGGVNYANDVLGLRSVTGFPFWESLCFTSDFSAMGWDCARHLSDLPGQDGVFEDLAGHKQGTLVWVKQGQFLQARHVKEKLGRSLWGNVLTLWAVGPSGNQHRHLSTVLST